MGRRMVAARRHALSIGEIAIGDTTFAKLFVQHFSNILNPTGYGKMFMDGLMIE